MRWLAIILVSMCAGAGFLTLVFAALIIVLRASPKARELLSSFDPGNLKRTHRRWMWSLIPFALIFAFGIVLLVSRPSPVLFLTGILSVLIPVMGVLGVLLIGEVARSAAGAKPESR